MAGWNLKEGKLREIEGKGAKKQLWVVLASLFSNKSKKNTAYKFIFLKSILDNLYNAKKTKGGMLISFENLFNKFSEVSWNLVVPYGLYLRKPYSDGSRSSVEKEIISFAEESSGLGSLIRFESLSDNKKVEIEKRIISLAKKYVVGAVYEDTKGLFYSFSMEESSICISNRMYNILCEHKVILERANYFEWAKFLEKINENNSTDRLLIHLDESGERHSLKMFRIILEKEFGQRECFYCGKKLTKNKTHVDHFIPWSFVKNDNIWNFVLACSKCNNMKRDKLPSGDYLDKIEYRNRKMILEIEKYDKYSKDLVSKIYEFAEDNGYNEYWSR